MAAFTILAIASIASAAYSTAQKVKAGKAEKKAGQQAREASESQADLVDWNAEVAGLQADDAIARGAQEEQRFRQGVRGMIGSQRAAIAAGNVDVGFGSALDVQADAAMLGELDALQIRTNAAREAWGYKIEAEDLRKRAQITRKEGVMLEAQGRERARQQYYDAGSTVLGAGTSLLSMRYGFSSGGGGRNANSSVNR